MDNDKQMSLAAGIIYTALISLIVSLAVQVAVHYA